MCLSELRILTVVLSLATLASCATSEAVRTSIRGDAQAAEALYQGMDASKRQAWIVRNPGANLAGSEFEVVRSDPEPAWLDRKYVYVTAGLPAEGILAAIGGDLGIPMHIQPEATGREDATLNEVSRNPPLIRLDWNGPVRGLLDRIALATGLYWRHEAGRVRFFATETRNFPLHLPAAKTALSASISLSNSGGAGGGAGSGGAAGGSTGGGGGSGNVSVSSTSTIDAYDALVKSVQGMLQGAKVAINPALGMLTVTATPPELDRVEAFIQSVNDRFARNVVIGIQVYNLSVTRDENAGVKLDEVFQSLSGKTSFTLGGAPLLSPKGGTPGSLIVDRDHGGRNISLLLQTLSGYGDVSLVTSGQVIAANGQPSPFQVGNEVSYLASSTTTQIENAGIATTLTPGKQTVGFTANFLPRVLGDNRILLQYQINLSNLLSLDRVQSGTAMIQTPNVSTQSLQQQAFLKDGQSLVLFGFEARRSAYDQAAGLTGYSRNASANRQMMVIVMEVYSGQA